MATYVISDIHGCFDEFQAMLDKIRLSESDRLILAGDYIDRGKQSLEMLRWLERCPANITAIKGNHDSEFAENVRIMRQIDKAEELMTDPDSDEDAKLLFDSVKYILKRKAATALSYYDHYGTMEKLLVQEGVTFRELCRWADMLDSFPFFYRFPMNGRDCVVVHAGFCEEESAIKDSYSCREEFFLYAREDALQIGGVRNGLIIAGHTPTIAKDTCFYTDGEVFRYHEEKRNCIFYNIDCGCAYYERYPSGTLACLRLEDEETFYL